MTGAPIGAGPLNLRSLKRAHSVLLDGLEEAIAAAADSGGRAARRLVASADAGFTQRTGGTARATSFQIIRTRNGTLLKVTNRAKHAHPLERGSRPHRIDARNARALRFGPGPTFRRAVNHPGTKPTFFLRKATERAGSVLEQQLNLRMRRLAAEFNRRRG